MTVSFYGTFCSKDLCWFFAKECNFAQEVDPLFLGEKNVVPSGQTGFESPKKNWFEIRISKLKTRNFGGTQTF